jgi:hypothetical protein
MKNVTNCISASLVSDADQLLPCGLHLQRRDYSGVKAINSDGSTSYFLRQFQGDNELVDVTPYVGDRNLIKDVA